MHIPATPNLLECSKPEVSEIQAVSSSILRRESEPGFRYMRCLHSRDSVQFARATRVHVPTMYVDTREQLCVSNNEICAAAVAVQAKKEHLGHGHLSPDFGI